MASSRSGDSDIELHHVPIARTTPVPIRHLEIDLGTTSYIDSNVVTNTNTDVPSQEELHIQSPPLNDFGSISRKAYHVTHAFVHHSREPLSAKSSAQLSIRGDSESITNSPNIGSETKALLYNTSGNQSPSSMIYYTPSPNGEHKSGVTNPAFENNDDMLFTKTTINIQSPSDSDVPSIHRESILSTPVEDMNVSEVTQRIRQFEDPEDNEITNDLNFPSQVNQESAAHNGDDTSSDDFKNALGDDDFRSSSENEDDNDNGVDRASPNSYLTIMESSRDTCQACAANRAASNGQKFSEVKGMETWKA